MKILLDENLDWRLSRDLPGHDVNSVPLLKNGDLLSKAEKQFEVLLTMDSNMFHQQNLPKFQIAVIVLKARSNRLADTRPLMSKVIALLPSVKAGTLTHVS